MKYGLIAAIAATALAVGATPAASQTLIPRRDVAWCAVHRGQCVVQRAVRHDRRVIRHDRRDIRHDVRDIVRDRHDIRCDRRDVRKDVRHLRIDRSAHNAAIGQRRADAAYRAIFGGSRGRRY